MRNQTYNHTGFAGTAKATRLGTPALGRARMSVSMKDDANWTSLAVRWKP